MEKVKDKSWTYSNQRYFQPFKETPEEIQGTKGNG
jgi:hypothetical protein